MHYIFSYCSSKDIARACKRKITNKHTSTKIFTDEFSKRVIKTWIYKKVNLPLVSNNKCRSGRTKRKKKKKKQTKNKFSALYENIPQVPTLHHYIQTAPTASCPHCIDHLQLKHCRRVSLVKLKYDSNINKAEHGYNIGMHAVDKHPVNNILRLNKVFS